MRGEKIVRCEFVDTTDLPVNACNKPYKQVINNGCVVETQSEELIRQLEVSDIQNDSNIIGWDLFRRNETILIDDNGKYYACTQVDPGKFVRLNEITAKLKYIVIECYEREIFIAGIKDSQAEAFSLMKDRVDSFHNDLGCEIVDSDDWELNEFSAWSNANDDCNADWVIKIILV